MGIPSFYKHLIQTITGLTSKTRTPPAYFGLDLNCAIYHCVHKLQKSFPYSVDNRIQWEAKLIQNVIAYIEQMRKIVQPTEVLHIAVDGVAPMAKIKQQRSRRFKSAISTEEMARITAMAKGVPYKEEPRWDTNAITPGTQFMASLAVALRDYAKRSSGIIVSPADEPGEGEQKIMEYIRSKRPATSVVYGLDADLIILSILTAKLTETRIDLFREEVEFNGVIKVDALAEEQFLYMDSAHLSTTLFNQYGKKGDEKQFIYDFVGLMSILGNDFVPHGMTLKIRDEGIPHLMKYYATLTTPVVDVNTLQYNKLALVKLFELLAIEEVVLMTKSVKKKLEARIGSTSSKDAVDIALARYNDTPLVWAVENVLAEQVHIPSLDKPQLKLIHKWEQLYDTHALMGADTTVVAESFLKSLLWTLAYYMGQPIDTHYYYPWLLPPRIATVKDYIAKNGFPDIPNTPRPPIEPKTQLAMVLPTSSFNLLPKEYGEIVINHPHAWPTKWGYFSFGRRFLWECEPLIPLVSPNQMKAWIEEAYEP